MELKEILLRIKSRSRSVTVRVLIIAYDFVTSCLMKFNCYRYKLPLLLILPVFLIYQSISANEVVFESVQLEIAGELFDMEIAKTPKQQQRGLMHRTNLGEKSGMIFLYSKARNNWIWMKNTLIPLTVIWLDDDARVIDIKKLQPCRQRDCPIYGVNKPSKFVIELNIRFNALKPGDQVPALLNLK